MTSIYRALASSTTPNAISKGVSKPRVTPDSYNSTLSLRDNHVRVFSSRVTPTPITHTNKADLSAIDGINSEHKQEQRQSSKDARPARRRRQPTSRRCVRNDASQHGRGGGTLPHQPTPDRRVRATHQADATPWEARKT